MQNLTKPSNPILWDKIQSYNLDNQDEYNFSTRLSYENNWTIYFAEQAILEYKKFMYLATISTEMVSPSPIVDIVWHQHLIFTNSYSEFCILLGKKIEHIPSTHNKSQQQSFIQAQKHTCNMYEKEFGQMPDDFWKSESMLDTLNLEIKKEIFYPGYYFFTWIGVAILLFFTSTLFEDIYLQINNPYFLYVITGIFISNILIFNILKQIRITKIKNKLPKNNFLNHLKNQEIIYYKEKHLSYLIHPIFNELLTKGYLELINSKIYNIDKKEENINAIEYMVLDNIPTDYAYDYPYLVNYFIKKEIFERIKNTQVLIDEALSNSKEIIRFNLIKSLSFGLILGIMTQRLTIGSMHGKNVYFLALTLFISVFIVTYLTVHINRPISFKLIQKIYKNTPTSDNQFQDIWQKYLDKDKYENTRFQNEVSSYQSKLILVGGVYTLRGSSDGGSSCGTSCGGGSSCGGGGGGCGGCGS